MGLAYDVNPSTADDPILSSRVATGGEAFKDSETTRLLSAAAYLDHGFTEFVIKWRTENKHRAIAPNFGVDMATVLRHCEVAQRKLLRRDLWLSLAAIAAVVILMSASADTPPLGGLFLIYLVAFGIYFWFASHTRSIVVKHFLRGTFTPDAMLGKEESPEPALIRGADSGNVVVYSGFTPFVGSGQNVGGWSFAIDLRKRANGERREVPAPGTDTVETIPVDQITARSLYGRVARDLEHLQLDRVSIEDKLYINGRDILEERRILDHPLSRPRNRVPGEVIAEMLEQADKKMRHYRCIRVVDWSGEVVLSIFVRFTKLSHNLFVEASYFLLTPVGERFRKVDTISRSRNLGQLVTDVMKAAIVAPFLTIWAPLALLARMQKAFERWSARRHEDELIRCNPSFDYGARFSCRQWASVFEYRRYFQKLDEEMYLKILEKSVLDSILTFLEENDVDVSDFKQRESMILNNGVIVSGGSMTTQNLSVGKGATVENVKQKITNIAAHAKPAA